MIKKDRVRRPRRKICQGCVDHIENVDYKDIAMLRRFISERGKILPRRVTGICAKHQRKINLAIKRARAIALLPFSADKLNMKELQAVSGMAAVLFLWFREMEF